MSTATTPTSNATHNAGFPPAPPEAHQRAGDNALRREIIRSAHTLSRQLTNRRGEHVSVEIALDVVETGPRGSLNRWRYDFWLVAVPGDHRATSARFIPAARQGVYGDGSLVCGMLIAEGGKKISLTSGDLERLGTYPIFIAVHNDGSSRGRYALHYVDDRIMLALRALRRKQT